jgi:hypothetical protein
MLRYVPSFRTVGARVAVRLPPELQRLANAPFSEGADYFCPILHLLHFLHVKPQNVDGRPYLAVDAKLVESWRSRSAVKTTDKAPAAQAQAPAVNTAVPPSQSSGKKRVGVAWSIGKPSRGDYPREIPVWELVEALGDVEIHSVQTQNADEARELGVIAHQFEDFADCAAMMMCMDEIVSVDTAALHLAGAIGHPRVTGLLSHWASWRWLAPWYANMRLCRQAKADDWSSALAQLHS